ncbi:MAG: hypothetical protein NVV59_19465 [Chitinophagaceae bacterium]|nr:hypothetical protein [Chitinophagaceae bacterium]
MLWSIALATPFFVFFGWLSDKIGRKWIMMAGMLLGIICYRPIFSQFLQDTNVKAWVKDESNTSRVLISSDSSRQENNFIVQNVYQYSYNENKFTQSTRDTVYIEGTVYPPLTGLDEAGAAQVNTVEVADAKPLYSNVILSSSSYWKFVALVWLMIIFVTMVYGPIAAFLVEMFPTRIRYTSMSLPYHIGNGVFGGLVPFIGLLLTTTFPADPLVGLWYPIGVAALCLVIGTIYLRNKIDENVND